MSDLPILSRTIPPWLAVSSFEQAERLALLLSKDDTLPKHCVGKPGVCFRLVVQAMTWGVNPYTVAEASNHIGGKISYSGVFTHALLLHLGVLATHFVYSWGGNGPGRAITLSGVLKASGEVKTITGTVGQWRGPSQQWALIPDDMLYYHACRAWQRRYAPEVTIGGGARDEAEDAAPAEATVVGEVAAEGRLEELEAAIHELVSAGGQEAENLLRALLKGYGVEHVRDLTPERFVELRRRMTSLLAARAS